jgi:hypothetical protein
MHKSWSIFASVLSYNLLLFPNGITLAGDVLAIQRVEVGKDASVWYLKVDLRKFDVRVITARVPFGQRGQAINPERAPTGFSLEDYQRLYHATAVISGGYLASFAPPTSLGLVKSNDVLVSPPHNTWLVEGIYCDNPAESTIQQWTSDADISNFRDCLQAGPLLLYNGSEPSDVPSKHAPGYDRLARSVQEQAFLCTSGRDEIIIGVTQQIDLPTLTNFLKSEAGCVTALRLTGKDTAGLRLNDQLYGKDQFLLPNALAVIPHGQ